MDDYGEEYDCILNEEYRKMDSSILHNFILSNLNYCHYFAFVFGQSGSFYQFLDLCSGNLFLHCISATHS